MESAQEQPPLKQETIGSENAPDNTSMIQNGASAVTQLDIPANAVKQEEFAKDGQENASEQDKPSQDLEESFVTSKEEPSFADDSYEENFESQQFGNLREEDEYDGHDGRDEEDRTDGGNVGENRSMEPEQFRKIFIGALPAELSDEGLKEFYSQWGEVVDCVIMRDRETRASRRFGFIAYINSEAVDLAMKNRPHKIMNKVVDPKRAIPKDATQDEWNFSTKRMYVSGVRESHTEEMFQEYFMQFGAVEKVDILTDKVTGKPRGFGFVNFEDSDIVDKCVLLRSHQIGGFRCDVKKAQSKEGGGRGSRGPPISAGRDSRKRPHQGGGGPPRRSHPQPMSAWDSTPPPAWSTGPSQAWAGGWAPGGPTPAQDYGYGATGVPPIAQYGGKWAEDVYAPGWGGARPIGGSGSYSGGGYGGSSSRGGGGWSGNKSGRGGRSGGGNRNGVGGGRGGGRGRGRGGGGRGGRR